jgi:DNA-binding transcriptional ArsR family regulator
MNDTGRIVLGTASRELRRSLRPIEWVVLEDVALDARPDRAGALVASTSARRVADHLGLTPGAVARALSRLRSAGLVTHARQVGPGGRFGLSAYRLGPVPGLDVEVADPSDGAAPRPLPPCLAPPHAVETRMVGPTAAPGEAPDVVESARRSRRDVAAAVVAAVVDDVAAEEHPAGRRSPARRGRRPVSQPGVVQLSILDASDDMRHP